MTTLKRLLEKEASIIAAIIGCGIWASYTTNPVDVGGVIFVIVALVGRWALNQAKVAAAFVVFAIAIVGAGIACGVGIAALGRGELRSIVPLLAPLAVLAVVFWPGGRKALVAALKITVSLLLVAAIVSLPVQGQTVKTASVAVKVSSGSGSANGIAQTNTVEVVVNKGLKPSDKGWINPDDEVALRKYAENYLVEAGYLHPAHQHQDGIRPADAVWIVVILIIIVAGIIVYRLIRFCQDHFGAPPPPPAPPPGQGNLSGYASVDPLWEAYSYLGTCPAGPPSVGLSAASVAPPNLEQSFEVTTVIRPGTNEWGDPVCCDPVLLGIENLKMVPRTEWETALADRGLSFTNGYTSAATINGQPIADEARPVVVHWGIPYATNTAYWSGPFFWQTLERAPTPMGPWKTIFTAVLPAGVTNRISVPVIAPWEWEEVARGSFFRAMISPY
ncbi:MAG: hypothetical protein Q7K35_05445 [bacterium]|nr:hypothetical protein [bacterium]